MRRFEYKAVRIQGSVWRQGTVASQEALLDVLNREGRGGWRLVVTPPGSLMPWSTVLLEREVD